MFLDSVNSGARSTGSFFAHKVAPRQNEKFNDNVMNVVRDDDRISTPRSKEKVNDLYNKLYTSIIKHGETQEAHYFQKHSSNPLKALYSSYKYDKAGLKKEYAQDALAQMQQLAHEYPEGWREQQARNWVQMQSRLRS